VLILSRKPNQSFDIFPENLPPEMTIAELFAGGKITVQILDVSGSQVKIGIDAPKQLTILRDNISKG